MEWKKVMKLSVAPLAFSLMLVGCSNDDRTVATIDDIKITESELDNKLKSQYGSEVLDSIIANKIVELEAEKKKITVSDEEFDTEVANMAKAYQMEADKFKELISEKEKEQITMDMAVQKAVDLITEAAIEE